MPASGWPCHWQNQRVSRSMRTVSGLVPIAPEAHTHRRRMRLPWPISQAAPRGQAVPAFLSSVVLITSTPAAPGRRAEPHCLREFVIAGTGLR
jgi:hypothetical protein